MTDTLFQEKHKALLDEIHDTNRQLRYIRPWWLSVAMAVGFEQDTIIPVSHVDDLRLTMCKITLKIALDRFEKLARERGQTQEDVDLCDKARNLIKTLSLHEAKYTADRIKAGKIPAERFTEHKSL